MKTPTNSTVDDEETRSVCIPSGLAGGSLYERAVRRIGKLHHLHEKLCDIASHNQAHGASLLEPTYLNVDSRMSAYWTANSAPGTNHLFARESFDWNKSFQIKLDLLPESHVSPRMVCKALYYVMSSYLCNAVLILSASVHLFINFQQIYI